MNINGCYQSMGSREYVEQQEKRIVGLLIKTANQNSYEIVTDDMSGCTGTPLSASINQPVYLENLVRFFRAFVTTSENPLGQPKAN